MTENSGVLNKLMADNPNNKVDALEWISASDDEKFSSASRIVQVRYRFYAVWTLLVVLLLLFWFLLPGRDTYQSKKSEIDSARRTLEALEARENKYKESIWSFTRNKYIMPVGYGSVDIIRNALVWFSNIIRKRATAKVEVYGTYLLSFEWHTFC